MLNPTCVTSLTQPVNSKKRTFLIRGKGKNLLVHTGALCFPCRKISKLLIHCTFRPSTSSWKPLATKSFYLLEKDKNVRNFPCSRNAIIYFDKLSMKELQYQNVTWLLSYLLNITFLYRNGGRKPRNWWADKLQKTLASQQTPAMLEIWQNNALRS